MLKVCSSTSQNTGVAPSMAIASGVAGKVKAGQITASPGPTPCASSTHQQRIGAARAGDGVLGTGRGGQPALELADLGPHDVLAVLQHAPHALIEGSRGCAPAGRQGRRGRSAPWRHRRPCVGLAAAIGILPVLVFPVHWTWLVSSLRERGPCWKHVSDMTPTPLSCRRRASPTRPGHPPDRPSLVTKGGEFERVPSCRRHAFGMTSGLKGVSPSREGARGIIRGASRSGSGPRWRARPPGTGAARPC